MADELVKKRITEYGTEVAVDELDNSDVIFVDSTQHGTRKLRLKGIRDIISGIQNESIKSSGVSVTADNYATTITNVDNQPVNTIYTYAAGLQSSVTNLPSNNALNIMHYTYKYSVATNVGQVQIAIERSGENPAMYFRTTGGTPVTWGSWVKMANNADIEAIREELDNLDIETDATLTLSGKPADAKAAGDAIDDLKADLNSRNLSYNNFMDAEVLREDIYYEYTAINTNNWQGNLPATRVSAQEGNILTLSIADWHGHGTNVIGFYVYDSTDTRLKNWSIVPSELDEKYNYIGQFVMPENTSYVTFQPYVISGGEERPTVGTKYYYRNAILIKGAVSLDVVKVGTSNISDSAITFAKLQDNIKPYSIGLRYGTKYPNVDTVGQTITFYQGTCIFDTRGNEIFRSTEDIVANFAQTAQQVRIVFDRDNQTFLTLSPATDVNNDRYIVLGMITRSGSVSYPIGRGWIGIPHTIDGYDPYIKQPNPMWDLPSNWENAIETILEAKGSKFTFAIQTDTHYYLDLDQNEYYGNNLKALTNNVGFDFVANLGDVIRGYANETIDSDENMRASMTQLIKRYVTGISCPLMIAMGNHDTNSMWAEAFSGTPFTFAEVWGRMFKPSFNTNPKAVTNTGLMYYYTDFNDVRVIVLNTQDGSNGGFGVGQAQIDWFTNTALDTNKAVLVMSHVPLVNGWSVNSNYDVSYANIVTALQSFKTNGGTVIGCMSGHTHTQESKTVDDILYVTFRNQANLAEVVMIDIENKTIETISVGFNGNRSFTF